MSIIESLVFRPANVGFDVAQAAASGIASYVGLTVGFCFFFGGLPDRDSGGALGRINEACSRVVWVDSKGEVENPTQDRIQALGFAALYTVGSLFSFYCAKRFAGIAIQSLCQIPTR